MVFTTAVGRKLLQKQGKRDDEGTNSVQSILAHRSCKVMMWQGDVPQNKVTSHPMAARVTRKYHHAKHAHTHISAQDP